jgi:hypothetical protein
MKNVKLILIALAVAFMAASCGNGNSIDAALNQVEKAMDKVEKNKTSMTANDWKSFNEEMEAPCKVLNDALESNDVGTLKKLKISAVVLRMAAVAGEAAMHTAIDSLNVKMQETGIADSIAKISDALQGEEAQQGLEDLQKAVGELEKMLK